VQVLGFLVLEAHIHVVVVRAAEVLPSVGVLLLEGVGGLGRVELGEVGVDHLGLEHAVAAVLLDVLFVADLDDHVDEGSRTLELA
jgi:hypothetical protein